MKRIVSLAPALAVMLLLAACSKDGASKNDLPEVPPESVPVLAMVELPSGRSLGSAAAVFDAVQPGASAQAADAIPSMLTSAAGVSGLGGADLDKPVRAVVLDPKKHPQPVVLLVTVKDVKELTQSVGQEKLVVRNDLAIIGAPEATKAAHDYAFGTLARREAPAAPYAVGYVQPVLASYRAEIDGAKAQLGALMAMMGNSGSELLGNMLGLYIDGLVAMAEQTERVEARFAGQDTLSGVELVLHARPDTTFAGFCKEQKPDDFALVGTLPAHEAPPLVMTGRIVLGPARKPIVQLGEAIIGAMWSNAMNDETRAMIDPWLDLFTGRFAAVVTAMGLAPEMMQLIETTDSTKAADYSRQFMTSLTASGGATMEVMGMKQTVTFVPEAFTHDGVSVMAQKVDTQLPAEATGAQAGEQPASIATTSYFAGVDGFLGLASGSEQAMHQLIDAVRNKGPRLQPAGALAQSIAATQARKDSAVMFMNLGALVGAAGGGETPQSLVMSLGFDEARMRVFIGAGR